MTKAAKALTRIVAGQVQALVADGRWMPKR